ncbi:MAG TPA: RnfABCDGE type electron transport complex subunit D [Candidatus Hydrogenedentes bacterium]|nr:RnfABCDGE type electron transport complex subunit D [Candidatus Hydrogenedentota bacterium]HPG65429.1 RnfABCDGE type electron transport complex subunit D [Candidatus Hydrogenedentota bacterium]
MSETAPRLQILTSPHVKNASSTDLIMRHVVAALLPVAGVAVLTFGLSALLLILVATAACLFTERALCAIAHKPSTLGDSSAAITGILLALSLPPGFPLWMAAVGGGIAIALGKALFGGLGYNVFNPALVGRAFLQAAFPVAITTWTPPGVAGRFVHCIPSTLAAPFLQAAPVDEYIRNAAVDGFSGATALSLLKFGGPDAILPSVADLFTGAVAGSAGETSAFIILVCGAYLAARKMLDWRIPAAMLAGVFGFTVLFRLLDKSVTVSPLFMLCSGGLMLGAVFMATDMVTSPVTPLGVWTYGLFLGLMTVLIRLKGGLPEGVMYAILLGNAIVPLINDITQPRIYGAKKVTAKR